MSDKKDKMAAPSSFNDMLPRSIVTAATRPSGTKTASSYTGLDISSATSAAGANIYRNPQRRFYHPEYTTTAIYLPKDIKQKNRWRRWFYDHDELVGSVLDLHAELPYGPAEIELEDPFVKQQFMDCMDRVKLFSMLPLIDLEYLKVGEVFVNTPWDSEKGMWSHIILHNPDFMEVTFTPFADQECVIELQPDEELRSLIHSTKPEDQALKRKLPPSIVKRILTGRNIILDPNEVTHIARRSNPYDIRGTSIIDRIFRTLMYEDKLREAQITIADAFIYPLKLFKLGDPNKGWIPSETHQQALAQMLQQANFDPNFSLIYHYALNVEYHTVADKVMRLEPEWNEINKRKMIALGVSESFMSGDHTYASANVGLQTQLARYRAKRDLFEQRWIRDKFFRVMAEKNEWYKRDRKEIVGQYRVSRSKYELEERLMVPKLIWQKRLMLRDDQSFLNFLNQVYQNGKGSISPITLLQHMGLELEDELKKKKRSKKLEQQVGQYIHPPVGGIGGSGGITAKLKNLNPFSKKQGSEELNEEVLPTDSFFTGVQNDELEVLTEEQVKQNEKEAEYIIEDTLLPVANKIWESNLKSPMLSSEVVILLSSFNNKISSIRKKYMNDISDGISKTSSELKDSLMDIYVQGKLTSYEWTDFLPIYKEHYSMGNNLQDFSDMLLSEEFNDWIDKIKISTYDLNKKLNLLRNLSNTCYAYGQLKGFQEQGIFNVKISNVETNDGLRYKVNELLNKGMNMGSLISPKDEIVVFTPMIEGFDEEFENNVEKRISRYKDSYVNGIKVSNCPVEYLPHVNRYLDKLGKYVKKSYNEIIFVKDVINVKEWEDTQKKELKEKYSTIDNNNDKDLLITNGLMLLKTQKIGKVPIFSSNKKLYVSSWIGMEDKSIISSLLEYIDIYNDKSLLDIVDKNFNKISYDLNMDEIQSYKIFKIIEPISNDPENPIGYKITDKVREGKEDVDLKVIKGQTWDLSGKCINNKNASTYNTFKDNLKNWIDYPHKLDTQLKELYDKIK